VIRVERPACDLACLKKARTRTEADCASYERNAIDYTSGVKRFAHSSYYYAHADVKKLLVLMCRSKCCYCEQRHEARNLDVEHFRPKSGFRPTLKSRHDTRPGYYWLAYVWENLVLCCRSCNIAKGTRFPLVQEAGRARSHRHDLATERPLFVHPCEDDPRKHITFDGDIPVGKTRRGKVTIQGIELDRPQLREERLSIIGMLDALRSALDLAERSGSDEHAIALVVDNIHKQLARMRGPESSFSAMVDDYLSHYGI
jgi:uncharacterized protein (TIGR02646 family)